MTYSAKNDDKFLEEFFEHFGEENIPNPEHYPVRFDFLVKSFEHYKRMQGLNGENGN